MLSIGMLRNVIVNNEIIQKLKILMSLVEKSLTAFKYFSHKMAVLAIIVSILFIYFCHVSHAF